MASGSNALIEWIRAISDELDRVVSRLQEQHDNCQKATSDELVAIRAEMKDIKRSFAEHQEYHEQNKYLFGVLGWMRDHMKIVIISAILFGIVLSTLFGITIDDIIRFNKNYNALKTTLIDKGGK